MATPTSTAPKKSFQSPGAAGSTHRRTTLNGTGSLEDWSRLDVWRSRRPWFDLGVQASSTATAAAA